MSKILTQEEIDALLSTVAPQGIGSEGDERRVQLYDFKHPERISKDQLRTLRTIHDNFARLIGTQLSTQLRTLVDVNLLAIDQVTFTEYSMSIRVPGALYILKMEEISGKGIFEVSPQFILFTVDRLLGGFGDANIEPREITVVEQNVAQRVIHTMVHSLNEVWSGVQPLGLKIDGFEADPQFVQIARASDSLAIVYFEVRVRGTTFPLNFVFPYYSLELILSKLTAQSMAVLAARHTEEADSRAVRERIVASKLPLKAVLANTALKVRDLIALETDDLLQFDKRTSEPVEVRVSEKLKFFGSPGRAGSRRAVQIIRRVTPEEEIIYE
ncbi:MAG: flagellar motor switch protein FliM [Calditrichaeota bacterium]|nr:flagellar motor switch protein FliM [Calditrichota bacterium]